MKNLKLVLYKIRGTSNSYCALLTYRNKFIFDFMGKDLIELNNKAHIWASNQGYKIKP